VIHQNDPNDKEFYQLHWLCMSKLDQFLHVLLERMQNDLAADCCTVLSQYSVKNDCRKTHQDILVSGQTFWTRNWPRILSATNLTAMIYKITMYNSSVNDSHKQSNCAHVGCNTIHTTVINSMLTYGSYVETISLPSDELRVCSIFKVIRSILIFIIRI